MLDLARRSVQQWAALRERNGRGVLLAPPLHGAAAILRLATGRGPLFKVLRLLDGSATPSDIMKSLVVLPGVVDLLPDHALDARWWQRYSGDAPSASALSEARRRRSDLKLATNDSALTIVFGAADDTPTVDLNAADDLVSGVSREGDGWMINPVESVPAGQRWFVRGTHESLLSEATTARVAADLVQRDQTSATREAPDLRAPRNEIEPLRFPSQDDLTAVLLFGGEPPPVATRELRVRVAHGSLDRLGWPVAVGHYNADAIYGAEKFLDRCLGGCLSRRLEVGLGLYPGRAGTALHVPAPDRLPRGALVVGLGDVGELTADTLTRGIAAATVQFALHQLDTRAAPRRADASEPQPLPLTLASLLIGTRGGRWWRRLIISQEPAVAGAPGGLHFTTLTERARAEDRLVFTSASRSTTS